MTKVHDVHVDDIKAKLTMSPSDNDNAFHNTVLEKTQGSKVRIICSHVIHREKKMLNLL